jgi:hypothetical protein
MIRAAKIGASGLKAAPRKIALPVAFVIAAGVVYLGYQEPNGRGWM